MSQETNHKGVNDTKRFLVTLEREEKIITRFVVRISGGQLFGLNAFVYLLLIQVLLMTALATFLYFIKNSWQPGALEIYFVAFAFTVLLAFALRSWFQILKIRRINRMLQSLSQTVEEERRIAEDFINNNEN